MRTRSSAFWTDDLVSRPQRQDLRLGADIAGMPIAIVAFTVAIGLAAVLLSFVVIGRAR